MGREEREWRQGLQGTACLRRAPQRSPAELRKGGDHCPVELTASGCSQVWGAAGGAAVPQRPGAHANMAASMPRALALDPTVQQDAFPTPYRHWPCLLSPWP